MRWMSRMRMTVARHPWIHWAFVALLATAIGGSIAIGLAGVRREREAWGMTRTVLVATRAIVPGEPVVDAVEPRDVPVALVPAAAVATVDAAATAIRFVGVGEMLVAPDIVARPGPGAVLPDGWLAIDIADVDNPSLFAVGDSAVVLAGGRAIAAHAVVVAVTGTDVVVGVSARDAGAVADAANQRSAVIALS